VAKSKYEIVKAWRKRNKEKVNAQARRWRAKHPEVFKEIKLRHREKNLERIRTRDAENQRNMRKKDPEGYRRRMAAFKHRREMKRWEKAGRPRAARCDICGERTKTVFDHDHESGEFRGWLCERCNRVLGSVKDDSLLLRRLARYLEKTNGKTQLQSKETAQIKLFR
jgi:hypothetical protein